MADERLCCYLFSGMLFRQACMLWARHRECSASILSIARAGTRQLPLRLLDNFSLVGGKRGTQQMGLDVIGSRSVASLVLRGLVLPSTGRKRSGAYPRFGIGLYFAIGVCDINRWCRFKGVYMNTRDSLGGRELRMATCKRGDSNLVNMLTEICRSAKLCRRAHGTAGLAASGKQQEQQRQRQEHGRAQQQRVAGHPRSAVPPAGSR